MWTSDQRRGWRVGMSDRLHDTRDAAIARLFAMIHAHERLLHTYALRVAELEHVVAVTTTRHANRTLDDTLANIERRAIVRALDACGWVQARAAKRLGISPRMLNYKIKRFGLTRTEKPHDSEDTW